MKTRILFLIVICLLAWHCRKREYPREQVKLEKEEIFVEGSIDNEPLSLTIGTDGYYCFTSYEQRADSFFVFSGELKKYDCDPCPRSLSVSLNDYRRTNPGADVLPDSSLKPGVREILPPVTKVNTFKFVPRSGKPISSVHWQLDDGRTWDDTLTYFELFRHGQNTVSLTVRTENCLTTVTSKIYLDKDGGYFACSINSSTTQDNQVSFWAQTAGGSPPFRYTWHFGDGATSSEASPLHPYKYAGGYPVKVVIEDAEGRLCESGFNYVTPGDPSSCALRMTIFHTGQRNVLPNTARIQWRDQSNVLFSTDNVLQPPDSYFEVLKSENYEKNENGEDTRLLTIRLNVLLSDGTRTRHLKTDNAVIAVAYK